jgi:hypothetical protein
MATATGLAFGRAGALVSATRLTRSPLCLSPARPRNMWRQPRKDGIMVGRIHPANDGEHGELSKFHGEV